MPRSSYALTFAIGFALCLPALAAQAAGEVKPWGVKPGVYRPKHRHLSSVTISPAGEVTVSTHGHHIRLTQHDPKNARADGWAGKFGAVLSGPTRSGDYLQVEVYSGAFGRVSDTCTLFEAGRVEGPTRYEQIERAVKQGLRQFERGNPLSSGSRQWMLYAANHIASSTGATPQVVADGLRRVWSRGRRLLAERATVNRRLEGSDSRCSLPPEILRQLKLHEEKLGSELQRLLEQVSVPTP